MARDYSKFLRNKPKNSPIKHLVKRPVKPALSTLDTLGWQPHFFHQINPDSEADMLPVRVTEVHRKGLHIVGDGIDTLLPPDGDVTVGDWLLVEPTPPHSNRLLERKSLIKRRAPGTDRRLQLIAANIDTAFIVSSCNADFNVARLERYIALAFEANVSPVIILTKLDLCTEPDGYVRDASAISPLVPVVALDARGNEPKTQLAIWCKPGQTVAFIGSSGVGKSTLTNALSGTESIETQTIREDDAKGRHTTTRRQLHIVPGGCLLLDTPGMRELQMTDAEGGVAAVFSDLEALASRCRFGDCQHASEPGCAVRTAIADGTVDSERVQRWHKLAAENRFNSATLAERRSKGRSLSKNIRQMKKLKGK